MNHDIRVPLLVLLCACTGGNVSDTVPASSALSARQGLVFVADSDNEALARVDMATGSVDTVRVGRDPGKVARIGEHLFVSLRGERSVAVVEADSMTLLDVVEVGAEPWGMVPAADSESLFVALATENAVVRLTVPDLVEVARYEVPGQPRWLAAHPSGQHLYVASAFGNRLHTVDLDDGRVVGTDLPEVDSIFAVDDDPAMSVRVTGDLAISQDGSLLAVPTLFVDNHSPPIASIPYYTAAGGSLGPGRFNPAVLTAEIGPSGLPSLALAERQIVGGIGMVDPLEGEPANTPSRVTNTLGFAETRGYISALAFVENDHAILATIEGSSALVAMPAHPTVAGRPGIWGNGRQDFQGSTMMPIGVGAGPAALAVDGDKAYVWSFLDRTVVDVDLEETIEHLSDATLNGVARLRSWYEAPSATLEPSQLPPDVLAGREFFFTTIDDHMSLPGSGVSCATCHFESRNDGLSWNLDGPRQTPSLAGMVSLTEPVTWTGTIETVADDAQRTIADRMGARA
jgi:hypothetical protein